MLSMGFWKHLHPGKVFISKFIDGTGDNTKKVPA